MRIIPISLPTPFYIGPVNVYLIAEEPITLIDTGPKTKAALEALREGLRRVRFRVEARHAEPCAVARSRRSEAAFPFARRILGEPRAPALIRAHARPRRARRAGHRLRRTLHALPTRDPRATDGSAPARAQDRR